MTKICPKCNGEMNMDCYIQDSAKSISNLVLIEKDNNLKKKTHLVKAALCKTCGYIELYAEPKEEKESL